MNIYAKLAQARVILQEAEIKKSGENKHLNFKYSELKDFLPSINVINKNLGLISIFNINEHEATLCLVDVEAEPDIKNTIMFSSPVAKATLQGKPSPIQELGSQHTYMRRYLYLLAYEIAEGDSVDADLGRPLTKEETDLIAKTKAEEEFKNEQVKKAEQESKNKLTNEYRESIRILATEKKVPIENIESAMKLKFETATFEQLESIEHKLNLPPKNK